MRLPFSWLLFWWTLMQAAEPQPVATFDLQSLSPAPILDASPVFLSEDKIALLLHDGDNHSKIVVFRLNEGKLQHFAEADAVGNPLSIHAVPGERVLVVTHTVGRTILYSPDLATHWIVPLRERTGLFPVSMRGGVVGEQVFRAKTWELIELGPEMKRIRKGWGYLLSISDEALAIRRDNTIFFERLEDGAPLGSVTVPADTRGARIGELVGHDRFFLSFSKNHQVLDLQGKLVGRITDPPGWGFDHGWSDDGRRLLLDHFTRHVSPFERAIELASPVPVPEHSNGELIVVLDTARNKECYRSIRKIGTGFSREGTQHADLSPSGRLVAEATLSTLSVHRLPDTCSAPPGH